VEGVLYQMLMVETERMELVVAVVEDLIPRQLILVDKVVPVS